jgi:micrococcal nuclease
MSGALLLVWFAVVGPAMAADRREATVRSVLGGDSLLVMTEGRTERVRLLGITCQDPTPGGVKGRFHREAAVKGDRAKAFVEFLLKPGDAILLEFDRQTYDRQGNLLAYVFLGDGSLLNERLIREGLAWPRKQAPNARYDKRFRKAAERAAGK